MKTNIIEIEDYLELAKLFKENGLEVNLNKAPEHFVTCWKALDQNSELLGGVSIEYKKGEYVIGDIAVQKKYRKSNIGSELLVTALNRIKKLGGKKVYLVAKAPKFFEKFGFDYIKAEDMPPISNCLTCEQFKVTCFPELMCLKKL